MAEFGAINNLTDNTHDENDMGLSSGKGRIFRNPSGRSGRIVPDIRSGDSSEKVASVESENRPLLDVGVSTETVKADLDPETDFCWAHVTGSYRRERSIEGLLLGVSVGDALGLGRYGLTRRSALRMFGRWPLDYCMIPGVGIVSSDTHRMLMTLQSILRSRSQLELFRRNLAMRLRFYLCSIPVMAGRATLIAALRLCVGTPVDHSGINSDENSPLINGLTIASVLQGTGHSVERWVAVSSELTHTKPEAVESAVLIARTAYLAIMTDPTDFNSISLIDRLINITEDAQLEVWLKELRVGLEEKLGTHAMASRLGWGDSIPGTAGPTAIMSIYSWLRHHDDFEKVVEHAILLGGDSVTLGALAGGLAGLNLGVKEIPERWLSKLWSWPNNRQWLHEMTERFTDWPHGIEDLMRAPAMPTRPLSQLVRSGVLAMGVAIGSAIRLPWRFSNWIVGC